MAIKGVIFDVDGTLIDSMKAWNRSAFVYLQSRGIQADAKIGDRLFHMTISQAAQTIIDEYNLPESVDEVASGINGVVESFYKNDATLKDGALELLEAFKAQGIKMVVGTSTDRALIVPAMERLGILHFFNKVFTCSEIGKSKAEPDLFLAAAKELECEVDEIVVFEDGLYSIKTAKSLSMMTVGVYDEISAGDREEMIKTADVYLDEARTLSELSYVATGVIR